MKKRARSDKEKLAKKEMILKAACTLFSRYGYQGTTIEMITEESNLSPAAFYLYFKNKVEIYQTLTSEGIRIVGKIFSDATVSPEKSPSQKIRALADAYITYFREHREYYNITEVLHLGQGDYFADLDLVPDLEDQATVVMKLIESIVKDGIDAGEFRKVDPWKTAILFWGMMDGAIFLEVRQRTRFLHESLDPLIDQMIDIILNGVRGDGERNYQPR